MELNDKNYKEGPIDVVGTYIVTVYCSDVLTLNFEELSDRTVIISTSKRHPAA